MTDCWEHLIVWAIVLQYGLDPEGCQLLFINPLAILHRVCICGGADAHTGSDVPPVASIMRDGIY